MDKIELLAPAGDINKLKTAIEYGADAVCLGGESFGLRKASKNFTLDKIKEGADFAHERGKKIHVTLNIIPHNKDIVGLEEYVKVYENSRGSTKASYSYLYSRFSYKFFNSKFLAKNGSSKSCACKRAFFKRD